MFWTINDDLDEKNAVVTDIEDGEVQFKDFQASLSVSTDASMKAPRIEQGLGFYLGLYVKRFMLLPYWAVKISSKIILFPVLIFMVVAWPAFAYTGCLVMPIAYLFVLAFSFTSVWGVYSMVTTGDWLDLGHQWPYYEEFQRLYISAARRDEMGFFSFIFTSLNYGFQNVLAGFAELIGPSLFTLIIFFGFTLFFMVVAGFLTLNPAGWGIVIYKLYSWIFKDWNVPNIFK